MLDFASLGEKKAISAAKPVCPVSDFGAVYLTSIHMIDKVSGKASSIKVVKYDGFIYFVFDNETSDVLLKIECLGDDKADVVDGVLLLGKKASGVYMNAHAIAVVRDDAVLFSDNYRYSDELNKVPLDDIRLSEKVNYPEWIDIECLSKSALMKC